MAALTLFQATGVYVIVFTTMIIMTASFFIDKFYTNGPPSPLTKWMMRSLGIIIWIWLGHFTIPIYLDILLYPASVENKEITVAHVHYGRYISQSLYERLEDYRGYDFNSRDISFREGERVKLKYLKRSKLVLSATKIP